MSMFSWLCKFKYLVHSIGSLVCKARSSLEKKGWLQVKRLFKLKSLRSLISKGFFHHDDSDVKPRACLSDDSLLEILSWLPAKKLCQFNSVSGSVHRIITSRYFFLHQSQHVKSNAAILLQGYDDFELIFLESSSSSGVPEDSFDFLRRRCDRIVASSNGLLFFRNKSSYIACSGDLCAFNPVRGAFHRIYSPTNIRMHDCNQIGVAVVFDDHTADYHVITVTPAQTPTKEWGLELDCMSYSSRDMSWENLGVIDAGKRNIDVQNTVIANNGAIYWASDTGNYMNVEPYILEFDVTKNTTNIIPLPQEVARYEKEHYYISVASWADDALCLIQYTMFAVFNLWVMKKDCGGYSWVKAHEVNLRSSGLSLKRVQSFTVINSSLLVFSVCHDMYIYNLVESRLEKLKHGRRFCHPVIRSYCNTFATCCQAERFEIENFGS